MQSPDWAYDLWRRWAGRYTIDDPRPTAQSAPYTFLLPCENELLALAPGDLAKLIFRGHPPGRTWDAERMWVTITHAERHWLAGTLDNCPADMPQLRPGARIRFRRSDVIDCIWAKERQAPPPSRPGRREYWDRCRVDACVLEDGVRVHFLYRVPAEEIEGEFVDSGWRIRGDYRGVPDTQLDAREHWTVALGAVLNRDDSWLHLIDAPVGSAFIRDWENDGFVPAED